MPRIYWIGGAIKRKGALHRQLGIPQETKIPRTLLKTILKADTGDVVRNPTKTGRRRYRVTTLMQERVNPALTLGRFRHHRRRRA